jgi:hypothetical protein
MTSLLHHDGAIIKNYVYMILPFGCHQYHDTQTRLKRQQNQTRGDDAIMWCDNGAVLIGGKI